jgi:hypothetical protein
MICLFWFDQLQVQVLISIIQKQHVALLGPVLFSLLTGLT